MLFAGVLSGCVANDGVTRTSGTNAVSINTEQKDNNGLSVAFASGIRWNEEYLVSVKHLEDGSGLKKCASSKLDLAFYKKPITPIENIPSWADMKTGSVVSMEGFIFKGEEFNKIKGEVISGVFTYGGQKKYKLASNLVSNGMSGGPVKDGDGNVVGLIIGYTATPVKIKSDENQNAVKGADKQFSVLIPYSSVKEGWKEVKTKIAQGKC